MKDRLYLVKVEAFSVKKEVKGEREGEIQIQGEDRLELSFTNHPEKNDLPDASPSYGAVVFQALLQQDYPKQDYPNIKFQFTETQSNEKNTDTLIIDGDIQILCAIHKLCVSPIFIQAQAKLNFGQVRSTFAGVLRSRIINKKTYPDEHEVALPIINEYYSEVYQDLLKKMRDHFDQKIECPSVLSERMQFIEKIKNPNLEFMFPKSLILALDIYKEKKELDLVSKPTRIHKFQKDLFEFLLTKFFQRPDETAEKLFKRLEDQEKHYAQYNQQLDLEVQKIELAKKQAAALSFKLGIQPSVKDLKNKIQAMMNYGEGLKNEKISKGEVICDLATSLQTSVKAFFDQEDEKIKIGFQDFQKAFLQKIEDRNKDLSEYRVAWKTILLNIGIALSGIGVFVVGGYLAYTKLKEGQGFWLFAQRKTTSEHRANAIKEAINSIRIKAG